MAAYPYARVSALLDNAPSRQKTPTTLSGGPKAIYSYAKCIAWEANGQWYVVDRQSSPTTNRHISATARELESRGLHPITVDYRTGKPIETN